MVCTHPFFLRPHNIIVPCGRCLACRIQRTHSWASRLMFEFQRWKYASFVTLTYSDEFLPLTLVKKDLQKFFKRLRIRMVRDYPELCEKTVDNKLVPKIKYFACGEYGDKTGRPHYHAIIFGLSPLYHRQLIQDCWTYCNWNALDSTYRGRKSIGSVSYDSCRYVSGYIQKKLIGKKGRKYYESIHQIPPFQLQSQGLGLEFALDNKDIINDALQIGIRGYSIAVPRYYVDKLEIDKNRLKDYAINVQNENLDLIYRDYLKTHSGSYLPLEQLADTAYFKEYTVNWLCDKGKQREVDLTTRLQMKKDRLNETDDFYDL